MKDAINLLALFDNRMQNLDSLEKSLKGANLTDRANAAKVAELMSLCYGESGNKFYDTNKLENIDNDKTHLSLNYKEMEDIVNHHILTEKQALNVNEILREERAGTTLTLDNPKNPFEVINYNVDDIVKQGFENSYNLINSHLDYLKNHKSIDAGIVKPLVDKLEDFKGQISNRMSELGFKERDLSNAPAAAQGATPPAPDPAGLGDAQELGVQNLGEAQGFDTAKGTAKYRKDWLTPADRTTIYGLLCAFAVAAVFVFPPAGIALACVTLIFAAVDIGIKYGRKNKIDFEGEEIIPDIAGIKGRGQEPGRGQTRDQEVGDNLPLNDPALEPAAPPAPPAPPPPPLRAPAAASAGEIPVPPPAPPVKSLSKEDMDKFKSSSNALMEHKLFVEQKAKNNPSIEPVAPTLPGGSKPKGGQEIPK